jgi:hypothetical protein
VKRWPLRILLCLILLTGGAVTTVAVAWGFAAFDRSQVHERTAKGFVDCGELGWVFHINELVGRLHIDSMAADNATRAASWRTQQAAVVEGISLVSRDAIPSWSRVHHTVSAGEFKGSMLSIAIEYATGWPKLAARCTIYVQSNDVRNASMKDASRRVVNDRVTWVDAQGVTQTLQLEEGDGVREGILLGVERHASGVTQQFNALPLRPIWPGFAIDTLFYAAIWGGLFFGFASAKRGMRRRRGRCPQCGYDLRGNLSAGCSECGWGRNQ